MAAINITSGNGDTNKTAGARVLVRNASGIPYVVVENVSDSSIDVYKGNTTTPASFAEQDATNKPTGTVYTGISAAIDSAGIIHIAYMSHNGKASELRYVTFNTNTNLFVGDAQLVPDLGEDATGYVLTSAIAIDSSNVPHIAYTAMGGKDGTDIKYANKVGGSWTTEVEVEGETNGNVCSYPDICIDTDNKPCIVYFNETDNDVATAQGDANDAATFTLQDVDTDGSQTAGERTTSICVDRSGNHYVAYEDHGDGFIYLIKHSYGVAWTSWGTRATGSDAGINPSVVADRTDIYIFYEDPASHGIYYEKVTGGITWAGDTLLETSTYNTVKVKWAYWVNNDSEKSLVTDWTKTGNSLTITGCSVPALAMLSSTRVAFIDYNNDKLETYDWDGTDWTKTGNSLTITGCFYPALTALSSTRVAFIDDANEKLETYDWDGTDWTKTGNSLTITGIGSPALAALSSTRVAFIDYNNEKLETYDWDGTDWTKTGNSLTITGCSYPALAALSSTKVAFIDGGNDKLETYDWDGTDWTKTGNSLTITGASSPALAALSSTRVAFIDGGNEKLETYDWDGTDWTKTGNSLTITGCSWPALAMLSSTRVAFIESNNEKLETYDWDDAYSTAELDYIFVDETTTPDILWNKLVLVVVGEDHTQTCTDAITFVTTLIKDDSTKKILSLNLDETSSTISAFLLSEDDILDIISTISKDINVSLSEIIQVVESLSKNLDIPFSEALVFIEDISKLVTFNKLFSRALSVIEELKKEQSIIHLLILDILESSSRETGSQLDISDLVTFVEDLSIEFDISKQDAFSLVDTTLIVTQAELSRLETLDISEDSDRVTIFLKAMIDIITLVEVHLTDKSKSFSDILAFIDSINTTSGTDISIADILSIAAVYSKLTGKIASDVLLFTDSFIKRLDILKHETLTVDDAVISTGSLIRSDSISISENIIKNINLINTSEFAITEISTIISTFARELTELLEITEDREFIQDKIETIQDEIIIAEIIKHAVILPLSSTLIMSDSILKKSEYVVGLSATLSLVEQLTNLIFKKHEETVSIDDEIDVTGVVTHSVSDTISFADVLTRYDTKSLQEAFFIIDSLSRSIFSSTHDQFSFIGSISKQSIHLQTDSMQLLENLKQELAFITEDIISIVEESIKTIDISQTDFINIVDLLIEGQQHEKELSDSSLLVEAIKKSLDISTSDALNILDSTATIYNIQRTFDETIDIIDAKTLVNEFIRILTEIVSFVEITNRSSLKNIPASFLILSDLTKRAMSTIEDSVVVVDDYKFDSSFLLSSSFVIIEELKKILGVSTQDEFNFIDLIELTAGTGILKTDEINIIDTLQKETFLTKLEIFSILESSSMQIGFAISSTFDILEAISKSIDISASDILSMLESLYISKDIKKEEIINIAETIFKQSDIKLTDIETLSEEYSKQLDITRNEVLSIIDLAVIALSKYFTRSDSVDIVESNKFIATVHKEDIVGVLDTLVKEKDKILSLSIEPIESKAIESSTKLTDSFSVTENIRQLCSMLFTETIQLIDTFAKKVEIFLSKVEELLIAEAICVGGLLYKTVLSAFSILDSIVKTSSTKISSFLTISETKTFTSIFKKEDVIELIDSILKAAGIKKDVSLNLSEIITKDQTLSKEDVLSIIDISSTESAYSKELSASISVTELKKFISELTTSEILDIIDSIHTAKDSNISNIDSIQLLALLATGYDMQKIATVLIDDSMTKTSDRILEDIIQLSENIYSTRQFTSTDTIVLSDDVIKHSSLQQTETFSFDDAIAKASAYKKALISSLDLVDSIQTARPIDIIEQEELTILEVIKNRIDLKESETLIISEEDIQESEYSKTIAENVNLVEISQSTSYFYIDVIEETLLIDDLLLKRSIDLEDVLAIIDSITTLKKGPLNDIAIVRTDQNKTILNNTKKRTILVADKTRTILFTKE